MRYMIFFMLVVFGTFVQAETDPSFLPPKKPVMVRGLCIGAPDYNQVDRFIEFIEKELVPRKVNTLVLRVDYKYRYTSHPELISESKRKEDSSQAAALTQDEMKKIVRVCQKNKIQLVPLVNMLGHQSGGTRLNPLLNKYPQFDETPWVQMPTEYKWPNADKLYCKSYCPQHPDVHKITFDLIDEIMEVCETNQFHAGMDEVFYLGEDKCPRCAGMDRSKLFADEVNRIAAHVEAKGGRLWIWGDRMLDSKMTRLGIWEAAENDTHRSMDLINKNVVINDWHYDSPALTPLSFATKGYDVMICPWNKADVTQAQVEDYFAFQKALKPEMAKKYKGIIQTVWTSTETFLDTYYNVKPEEGRSKGTVESFKTLFTLLDQSK
jgi:hypothetical protein